VTEMTLGSPDWLDQPFSGNAPLFPLPNVVLFPHAVLPLHIFEPRYRQMTADVLEGERLIAMALQESVETTDELPAIRPIAGLGQVIAHERLEDGRYLLVLRGVGRVRLLREIPSSKPYRIGEFEVCPDTAPRDAEFDRQIRAEQIATLFARLFAGEELQRLVDQAHADHLPLGSVCDVLASTLPIQPRVAQLLLEELNSDVRSQMLWQLLKRMDPATRLQTATAATFPPGFSTN